MNNSNSPTDYNNPNTGHLDNDSIDIKHYLSLFLSNWYWFAIALFLSLSIAYGINRWSEQIYTVSSTLLIKDDQNNAISQIFQGSDGFRNQQNLNNEIGILKSFNLNYRVIQKLPEFWITYTEVGRRGIAEKKMYNQCPFAVVYESLDSQTKGQKVNIKILSSRTYLLEINGGGNFEKELTFGERFIEKGFDFSIQLKDTLGYYYNANASNRYYFYFSNPVSLANQYRGKLTIYPIGDEASLVTLSTTGNVPQQEADYLNMLMDVYLDFGLEYKNQTAEQTLNFIEDQLGTISDSLEIAEKDLENFRLANKLIDISREGVTIQNKLIQIDQERTRLIMQKQYYEYLKQYVESNNESADIIAPSVMGISDQLLVKLVDELSGFQKQKRQLSLNLNESLEPLKLIEEGITNTRNALGENIQNGLINIDQSIADVDVRLNNIEKEISKLPSTERQMINIQRKFDINNTVYTFLLEKRAEAGIARASNIPDNRIIDYAGSYNSSRIRPRESRNFMIAILLGLLIPILGLLLFDMLNDKIIDRKDIERRTTAGILGYISHNNLKNEMPVVENPGSTLSESFRSVRTNLKYFLKGKECPVISVTSTISNEGKTFVSSNLAAILALSNKKILLIGLDLRKPRIHRIFGVNNNTGISNFLIGEEKLENIIIKTEVENLWYVPSGPVPPNPAELIESDGMKDFIEGVKKRFDYIIVDTPPVAIVTDALLVASFADFYLFVVRQRYSAKNTIELIEDLHKRGSIKNLGIVVNDVSISGYYGYGLRYGYSMVYGYDYGYNLYSNYGKYGYSDSAKGYYKEDV